MAEPIGPEQRERLTRLVAQGRSDEACRLLDQWVRQHELTPWAMQWLGQLLLERGEAVRAGRAFFWSGHRDGEATRTAIAAFLRRPPTSLLNTLPRRARVAFELLPDRVRQDLVAGGVTPELAATLARGRRPVRWGRVSVDVLLGVFAAIGVWTVVAWLATQWRG